MWTKVVEEACPLLSAVNVVVLVVKAGSLYLKYKQQYYP